MRQKKITIQGDEVILDGRRALFHQESQNLVIADFHLQGHKPGTQKISLHAIEETKERYKKLIEEYSPKKIFFLGNPNQDNEPRLRQWLAQESNNATVIVIQAEQRHAIGNLQLQHEGPASKQEQYVVCGKLHPAIELEIPGKGTIGAPCFWMRKHSIMLPSFSSGADYNAIKATKEEKIYLLADGFIIEK